MKPPAPQTKAVFLMKSSSFAEFSVLVFNCPCGATIKGSQGQPVIGDGETRPIREFGGANSKPALSRPLRRNRATQPAPAEAPPQRLRSANGTSSFIFVEQPSWRRCVPSVGSVIWVYDVDGVDEAGATRGEHRTMPYAKNTLIPTASPSVRRAAT